MAKLLELGNGLHVKVIGDVHLGRRFISGVPMHRRGEREAMIMSQFVNELEPGDAHMVVQVGDILDKAIVSYTVLTEVADVIEDKAKANPSVLFIFVAGNHDLSKDVEKVSGFLLLKRMLSGCKNVHFVVRPGAFINSYGSIGICPYFPWGTAEDAVAELKAQVSEKLDAVFGHWDIGAFAGDNRLPMNELAEITTHAYSGHLHKPGLVSNLDEFGMGLRVEKIGSMQPYAHGEEVNELLYVTRNLEDLAGVTDDYKDRCLRVILKPGEDVPNVECLQLTIKRLTEDGEDGEEIDVQFENFDMNNLFTETLTEAGVSGRVMEIIRDKFTEMRGQ